MLSGIKELELRRLAGGDEQTFLTRIGLLGEACTLYAMVEVLYAEYQVGRKVLMSQHILKFCGFWL